MKYNRPTCPVAELQCRNKLLSVRVHGRVLEFMDAYICEGISPSAELGPNLHIVYLVNFEKYLRESEVPLCNY